MSSAKGFWVSPRRYPDFAWAWLTRFLLNLGNALGTLYLFFYLQDAVGYGDPDTGVLVLTAIYSLCVILTAVWSGSWSDRIGRRKIFVTWAGIVMAAGGDGARGLADLDRPRIIGAMILGTGFGVYLSVDFALLTEVLPSARDRAKDLGVDQHRQLAAPGDRPSASPPRSSRCSAATQSSTPWPPRSPSPAQYW